MPLSSRNPNADPERPSPTAPEHASASPEHVSTAREGVPASPEGASAPGDEAPQSSGSASTASEGFIDDNELHPAQMADPQEAPHDAVDPDSPHWRRECFIPIRKSELIRYLAKQTGLNDQEQEEFLAVCRVLDATLHFEYQGQLDQLKDAYAPFNPDTDTRHLKDWAETELAELAPRVFDSFVYLLNRANYERLSREEIQRVVGAASDWGVRLRVDFEIFERLEVFVRGDVVGQRTRRRLRNLYRLETVDVDVYQRLIVVFRLRGTCDRGAAPRPTGSDLRQAIQKHT